MLNFGFSLTVSKIFHCETEAQLLQYIKEPQQKNTMTIMYASSYTLNYQNPQSLPDFSED
jgi:hypothetical protein